MHKMLRIPQLVCFTACLFAVQPTMQAQNMLARNDVARQKDVYPLEDALLRLEKIHKVKFSYNSEILRGKNVPAQRLKQLEQYNLADALPAILQPLGLAGEAITSNYYVIKASRVAAIEQTQTFTVKGKVVDATTNEPLPGVTVSVKGKSKGTATDAAGNYTLNGISNIDVLMYSIIGYEQFQQAVGESRTINVKLNQASAALGEVVVTALGIQKEKKSLGYAVQEVKGESMTQAREANLVNSLTGRVAGLTISNSTDLFRDPGISLRGQTPLIVIDGIPDPSADFWKVNPDDVESLSVLKGPTASALYGSIGKNGAIMITTKRGKGTDMSVEFNSSTMFQPSFIRIPDVQSTYGNGYKGKYAYTDGSGGGTEGSGWIWGPKLDQRDPSTASGYWETPQYNSPVDPVTGVRSATPFLSRGKNNVENFFQTGLISTNNISVTKGSDKGSFRASASHIYQKGVVPNSQLNNSSFSVAGNYNLTSKLKADARITYNRQYTDNYPENGYGPMNYLYNLVLWTGPDVDIRDLKDYWVKGKEGIQQKHYNNSWYNNPYFQAYELKQGYYKDNTFGSLTLDYKINGDFNVKFRNGINAYGLNENLKEPVSYIRYSDKSRGNYTTSTTNYFDILSELMVQYNHTFSKNFSVNAQVGSSNFYRNRKYQTAITDGLTIPGIYNLSNSAKPVTARNIIQEDRTFSYYGFVDFEFYKAFYVTVTGRTDKISSLPTQNNTFFYPSVSGSVVVSELVKLPGWTSYLKARASVSSVSSGTIFNSSAYPYDFLATYDQGVNWDGTPSLTYSGNLKNPDVKPQTTNSYEVGLEWKGFKNRVGFDVTYFNARDFNNIINLPVSVTSGYESRKLNGNEYRRKGFEIVLTGTPIRNKNFEWNVLTNWSHMRNTLSKIYGNASKLGYLKVGDNVKNIYDNVYQRDPQGNIIYRDNGFPLADNYARYIGHSDPDWVYGVENNFRYKNFSMRVLVDGRIGGLMYSSTNQKMWWGGTHPGTVNQFRDDANAGKATYVGKGVVVVSGSVEYDNEGNIVSDTRKFAPNTQAVNYIDYMINTSNAAETNYNYYSNTFLKLREVTFTYNLPSKLVHRTFLRAASVSLVGRNLLLLSKLPNVDPDPGYDALQTPSMRSYGFNIDLKF
ncbi:TonB-linked SusC/RagA family outer membrane protein [Chitinophaga skermanii]|uniref:TonB-linked SusC/RagA family outer membrane protein n=1 Tax=Chitinophaga skermanii TaxID=331697 RepID=A0A327QQH8_9BACT|nr:SusC/RagA family TonB-linked outer membrane protein [Chitinophaga skermanii]RAJ04037.1 TonB-linked SusC/RagA family outer membrane protein [Chitinophaga skermanii]